MNTTYCTTTTSILVQTRRATFSPAGGVRSAYHLACFLSGAEELRWKHNFQLTGKEDTGIHITYITKLLLLLLLLLPEPTQEIQLNEHIARQHRVIACWNTREFDWRREKRKPRWNPVAAASASLAPALSWIVNKIAPLSLGRGVGYLPARPPQVERQKSTGRYLGYSVLSTFSWQVVMELNGSCLWAGDM